VNIGSYVHQIRRFSGLIGWTAVDQFLFALSNLAVTLAVARGGGAEALGRFSVAFAAYLIVLGCSRALVSEPLLALPQNDDVSSAEAKSNTLTLLCAIAGSFIVAVVGLILGRVELLVIAVALPPALAQDILRYQAFRRQKPAMAALLDASWLVASLATWRLVTTAGSTTVALLCWTGGALLSIGIGWRALRPRLSGARVAINWWRQEARSLANPLLLDGIIYIVSGQALVFVVASMVGDDQLGVLRAGQVYFAPLGLLLTALGVLAVPHLAQRPKATTGVVAVRIAAAASLFAAIICGGILAAQPLLHSLLYGNSIAVPKFLLVPLAIQVVLTGAAAGPAVVTRARRRGADMARSRLTAAIVGVGLLIWATATFGVIGAAWALVGQTLWYTAHLGLRVKHAGAPRGDTYGQKKGDTVAQRWS
jgi:O-antigen/teichoic acid export membrane protein